MLSAAQRRVMYQLFETGAFLRDGVIYRWVNNVRTFVARVRKATVEALYRKHMIYGQSACFMLSYSANQYMLRRILGGPDAQR